MPDMYAAIFAAGALGYGLNLMFLVIERQFDAHLAVIERLNPRLNAIVTLAAAGARVAASAAEVAVVRGEKVGALHGLPVAIKDITQTAGIRTTFASPLFKDFVPEDDAEAVRRLKQAGAIVLAKTNTPEFATGANTVNALFGAVTKSHHRACRNTLQLLGCAGWVDDLNREQP
jgi:Asp-tRNA(Asn)/Glu-tRNA(Gln) amidotransferase A subunit family amidase